MIAIYKKEMRSYFINPIGYVYLGIFLAISALVCSYTTLQSNSYNTSTYFYYMIFAFAILIPILTMRSFAEEKTDEVSSRSLFVKASRSSAYCMAEGSGRKGA